MQLEDSNGNVNNESKASSASTVDSEWVITLQQFLASALTGIPISNYFGKRTNVSEIIAKIQKRRFERTQSLSDTVQPPSPTTWNYRVLKYSMYSPPGFPFVRIEGKSCLLFLIYFALTLYLEFNFRVHIVYCCDILCAFQSLPP